MRFKDRVCAPGPTPVPEESRRAMAKDQGYHRTQQFSDVIRRVTSNLQKLLEVDWPIVPLASSGTGAMEMAVQNLVEPGDRSVVIGGGKFGERWKRMVENRGGEVLYVDVPWGEAVDPDEVMSAVEGAGEVSAVFGTAVETSTLVRHPVEAIGDRLAGNEALFVVDAITAVGAEPFSPSDHAVDAVVMGAQKGLMGPPGLSFLAVSERAVNRAREVDRSTTYFDLPASVSRIRKDNQTPWTPPIELIRAVKCSLEILFEEGLENVYRRHRVLSESCREAVRAMGLSLLSEEPAVAGTAVVVPDSISGEALQSHIYDKYNCFIPGGQKEFTDKLIRIGHLGHVDLFDLQSAVSALEHGLLDLGYEMEAGVGVKTLQSAYRERKAGGAA